MSKQSKISEILDEFGYSVVNNPEKNRVELCREAEQALYDTMLGVIGSHEPFIGGLTQGGTFVRKEDRITMQRNQLRLEQKQRLAALFGKE